MIASFYIENRKKLVNFIKGYAGDYDTAEDIVQEVFLRLLELEAQGKNHFTQGGKVNFFFVYRSCVNLCINLDASKKKIQKLRFGDIVELDEWLQQPAEGNVYESEERYQELVSAITDEMDTLRWYDSEVLKLSLEYSVSALARGTSISRDSLRNTIKIAKNELRERTEKAYEAWQEAERLR